MNFFDFLNSINYDKNNLLEDPQATKEYNAFMINRGLSYFPDTVLFSNEMNFRNSIPIKWQYDFLRLAISKKKRFSKWYKKEQQTDDIKLICKHYGYSESKAHNIIDLLTREQINEIRALYEVGGRNS